VISIVELINNVSLDKVGREMYRLVSELYPICRSITGEGVRQTLEIIKKRIPLVTHEVPTGTKVFDWTVPKEWNIKDAYIKNPQGEKIVDLKKSSLHVVSYSLPIHRVMRLNELREHVFTMADRPDWIPYRTAYFKEAWGFCMSHKQMMALEEGEYEVLIDSSLEEGHLTYGELVIGGRTSDEVLISTHVCHPSLCNDNLSGIALATGLAHYLATVTLKYSYRFLFLPSTIGSITWLSQNERTLSRIQHGLVLACVGDSGKTTYKKSRRGNAEIDKAVVHVLRHSGEEFDVIDFVPYGYDERQFCSPGFNLPVGCLMRTPHGCYPEYHTSADGLNFVQPAALADSFSKCLSALSVLERNAAYVNLNPKCEPQLGRRGIFRSYSERSNGADNEMALLWVLNLSDGNHSLLDIAERSGLKFDVIRNAADLLTEHGLLKQ
jgi:aminopeptidase-like protein